MKGIHTEGKEPLKKRNPPKTREEAKQRYRQELVKKRNDIIQANPETFRNGELGTENGTGTGAGMGRGTGAGMGRGTGGGGGRGTGGGGGRGERNEMQEEEEFKEPEKPSGPKKNIHTIFTGTSTGSRGTKSLGGNVHGFK
uniref:Uncharacterized protein n=1 Tax=Amphimedon queenslandica TaxID=400682 RepID=A0A1X7T444_AMPQE